MSRRFSVHQFDNGLTVVIEFIPQAISTAVGFQVNTGARNEDSRLDGVSHFLEHMMFKGTEKRDWQAINREFDLMGARYNAFTSWEETCYYSWVLNEEVPRSLELLSDMLASALPENEFHTEKKVILEEIARYNDMPEHVVFEEAMKLAFAGHRLSSNILGSPKSIKALTREQMLNYFRNRYVPNNITLFACGNVDEPAFLKQVETIWGNRTGPRANGKSEPPTFHEGKKFLTKNDIQRQHIVLLWPALPIAHRKNLAAVMLGNILGDDRNSRIYWAVRHTGLAEEAGAGYWGFTDAGVMSAHAACDPNKAAKVTSILRAEAAKLKKGIRKEELERVKNRARTSLVFHAETPFNRFRQLMHQWAIRRELLTAEEMLQRVDEVKLDDLHQLLEEYPLDTPGVLVTLGPPQKKVVAAPARKVPAKKKVKAKRKVHARK